MKSSSIYSSNAIGKHNGCSSESMDYSSGLYSFTLDFFSFLLVTPFNRNGRLLRCLITLHLTGFKAIFAN